MQTVADMRGVGVKNRGKFADILCGRPLKVISYTLNFITLSESSSADFSPIRRETDVTGAL